MNGAQDKKKKTLLVPLLFMELWTPFEPQNMVIFDPRNMAI